MYTDSWAVAYRAYLVWAIGIGKLELLQAHEVIIRNSSVDREDRELIDTIALPILNSYLWKKNRFSDENILTLNNG